ncbi:hypothetical protein C8Q80DRAFT_1199197 [Daedaleopsis nitida]|nr:hypothetical protein C8Q80DRAFT_1199197 [Daedaleopsis nitida]
MAIPDALMEMFLFVLRECGVKNAPSFYYLRKIQKHICSMCGTPTIPCCSPQGNVFWMVDIRTLIAKDWSSPSVRLHIQVYPEILEDGSMSLKYGTVTSGMSTWIPQLSAQCTMREASTFTSTRSVP